ncbi:asparagine synthase-related protein [Paenibacillus solisilvae]|uniref:asparagine synthase (glutamine-hydrolyzing) n=1 Tax=Paenibacillus solisilvae TaxID=2486751 RepID=A0ABW0W820_9BACL
MSAIAGILSFGDNHGAIEDNDNIMLDLQRYRADYTDTWQNGPIFLGCLAQWVTPESLNERLPYYDAENKLAITADAIIDNREELFSQLQIEYTRRSMITDSELILLAYRKWGKETPGYLIGDFTFLIWDEREKMLFGARDLFGNRTLYYHQNASRVAFCTTINPLFALSGMRKELHELWLAEFLTIPVMLESSDTSSTVYKDIRQIPPAHTITVKADGGISLSQYSALVSDDKLELKSEGEYDEAFREVFDQAIKSSIRSYKPVGATLSGGLDSGAVVGFAAKHLRQQNKTMHTYSYIPSDDFEDWTGNGRIADERPFIQATVDYTGNITDNYLDFANQSPLSEVNDWLELLEMPYKFFENSFWIKGIFEKAEQQGIGVLLTGARGNHTISWGPAVHYYALLLRKLKWVQLYREVHMYSRRKGIRRAHLLPIIGKQALPFMAQTSLLNSDSDVPRLIHPEFARKTDVFARLQEKDSGLSGFLRRDATEARSNHLNNMAIANLRGTKGTKLSLKYSIWERDPTCDPRVVNFCLSVPFERYVGHGYDRALIRRATAGYLPDKVRLNQRIRGIQGADWVHRMIPVWPSFMEELRNLCKDAMASEYLDVAYIKSAMSKVGRSPQPQDAFDPEIRFLMRSVIVFRFIKNIHTQPY